MIEQIVIEMKANAGKIDFANGISPDYKTKQIAIGDGLYKVMLTCDEFPGGQKLWHLSISTVSFEPVPVEAAEFIRNAFFSESIEMPSILHGNRVKQYLARI